MTPEAIHASIEKEGVSSIFKIEFKKRNMLRGIFIKNADFHDLSVKNLWRIVPETNLAEWNKKQDNNLMRIYSGSDFVKLTSLSAETAAARKLAQKN
jgi:hypothetical protein